MNKITIWTYTKKEISDLKLDFENEFQTNLIRDYENVWEWIWNGNEVEQQINISREHNYEAGEHNKPLRIVLNWNSGKLTKYSMIKKVQSILKTDLYIGEIKKAGRNKEDYQISEIIKYET